MVTIREVERYQGQLYLAFQKSLTSSFFYMRWEDIFMKIVKYLTIILIVAALGMLSFFQVLAQENECAQAWVFTYNLDLPHGYWTEDYHDYYMEITIDGNPIEFSVGFDVTNAAPLYRGQVTLRWGGLKTAPMWTDISEINPSQNTVFQVAFDGVGTSHQESVERQKGTAVRIKWDDGDWVDLPKGPVVKACSFYNPSLFQRSWGHIY
jgi:hypothetical protein